MRWLVVLAWSIVVSAACKKDAEAPPQPVDKPVMTVSEVTRNRDACNDYVKRVCACAEKQPELKEPCALAKAYPDAMETAIDVAANTESTRRDALQAHDTVRKIAKTCIEELAKLPAAGCQ